MKNLALKLATVSLSVFACASAARAGFNQNSIGLNFGSSDGNNNNNGRVRELANTDSAGLPSVTQANWNNMPGANGFSNAVVNNLGGSVSVGVSWNSPLGTWSSGANTANFYPTNSPNNILAMGYLDNGTTTTVTITNLPTSFTANGYDVYVYTFFDTPNRGGTYTIVDAFNTGTTLSGPLFENSDANPTNFVQYPQSGLTNLSGNYLVFHGLSNPNIQLVAVANHGGTLRAPISAVQVVAAPTTGEAGQVTGLNVATNIGQIALSWTPGSGSAGSLVVMRAGFPATAQPVDGVTYTANSTFGLGENLGDDNLGSGNLVVFAGSGSSVTVSNVFGATNYYFTVYSFVGSGGSTDYTLASPPASNAIPTATITNIAMIPVSSPVVAGSARRVTTMALFDDGGTLDVSASVTLTSSAPAFVSVINSGRIAALTNGSATIAAVYLGFTNAQDLTVTGLSLTHRYGFNGAFGDVNAVDSVGGADALVVSSDASSGMDGGGHVLLSGVGGTSGSSNNFVLLPINLFSNYGAVTLEMWATDSGTGSGNWARLADIGANAQRYLFLTPWVGAGSQLRSAITINGNGAEQQINAISPGPGAEHHFVLSINGATATGRLFVDGVQVGVNTNMSTIPEDLGTGVNAWLGRSQFGVDNLFIGNFNEFRTYNGEVAPLQIAVNSVTGPDVITNDPGTCDSITLSINSPMNQGDAQQASVLANFSNIPNPVPIATIPEITYTSSNTNVVTVSATGVVSAVGGGSANVTAMAFGKSSVVAVSVVELPPSLDHRYSFDTDATDSIGGANGTVFGNVVFADGQAFFDGVGTSGSGAPNYILLPPSLLQPYNSMTLEVWYTDDNAGTWNRVWDFGSGTTDYAFLTVLPSGNANNGFNARTAIRTPTVGEQQVNFRRPSQGSEHHIIYTQDALSHTARVYLDGVMVATNSNVNILPSDLGGTANMYLARSQFGGDSTFRGLINEFRIWKGAITPTMAALSHGLGPDNFTTITNPGGVISVSVAVSNVAVGVFQQAKVVVNFASISGVNMAPGSSNWTSSDVTVAKVDQTGIVTAVGVGSANISATYNGTTGNGAITVSAAAAPVLLNRYSFTSDATDSIAGSNGVLQAGATIIGGKVSLTGVTNSYVELPGHLLDGASAVTIETWATFTNSTPAASRLWDFGWAGVTNWMAFAPRSGGAGNTQFRYALSYTNSGPTGGTLGEITLQSRGNRVGAGTGTNDVHYVVVIDPPHNQVSIYINGTLMETFDWNQPPKGSGRGNIVPARLSRLINEETYLGHSVQTNGTPPANTIADIDEFRIWSGALDKVQVAASYQNGPDTVSIDPGALSSISATINDPTAIVGSTQKPTVRGTFAGGTFDLTGLPGVGYSSDNTSVIRIDGNRLNAVGTGTANVITRFGGKSVTNTINVIAKQLKLKHRYNFATDARDIVGNADGTLFGNAMIVTNSVVLDGSINPLSYVELPGDLISGYDVLTIELFASFGASGNNNMFYAFGDIANGTGMSYVFGTTAGTARTATLGSNPIANGALGGGGIAEASAQILAGNMNNRRIQLVMTYDETAKTITVYTNGVLSINLTNANVNVSTIIDPSCFIGRSMFLGDPTLIGAVDDFRIYYGAMSAAQAAQSFAAGPDPETLTATIDNGTNVVVSWPNLPTLEGYSLQSVTSLTPPVNWASAGSATVVGNNNQVTIPLTNSESYYRLIKP